MRTRLVLCVVAALFAGTEATAAVHYTGMSYNYAEADLVFGQQKVTGDTGSGFGTRFEGAAEIEQELFGFLGFGFQKFSRNGIKLRSSTGSLGVGGHLPLSDRLDFVATVAGERLKLKSYGAGSGSYSGWGVSGGLRGQPREKLQWTAGVRYRSLEGIQSIYSLMAGGRYFLTPGFALGLDITVHRYDETTLDATESSAALTFRFDFGTRY